MTKVSSHFNLEEFLPDGQPIGKVPVGVALNIRSLALDILEPVRVHFGVPVLIHDGWRPPLKNVEVGGVATSDHLSGAASDFHVSATPNGATWEENTISAFDWLRTGGLPFGQLILEDHRSHLADPGKLWVHVSLRTLKHSGSKTDLSQILVSYAPGHYAPWKDARTDA